MTVTHIIAELIRQGAQLQADGDNLTIRAPKSAILPQRERLVELKTELLTPLRSLSTGSASLHPLSYGQKSLWFAYQLAPDSVAYNVVYAARITSELNVLALRDAFEAVIQRHPCLRTTYTAFSGEPAQVIHDFGKFSFDVVQAFNWSLESVRDRMDKEADRPFDLERGPVLRAHLFVRSRNEHFLLIAAHHIAVDAISMDVLIHDLCKLYNRETVCPLPLQYSDYVRWQVEMLAGPRGDQLWKYWQKELSGALPVFNLPTDRRRPPVQTYRGSTHSFALNGDLISSLKEVAKDNHTTLYTTVFAAFQVLLHRYSGQYDLLIGSHLAGRSQADFNGIVGYFVNPLVMRANLSGNPGFTAFLAQVRQTVLAALEHGDYPFSLLVERLQPNRDPSRSPLFQSAFVWINGRERPGTQQLTSFKSNQTSPQVDSSKLELEPIAGVQRGSELDLVLTIIEGVKSLAVQWRYNTDLFDAATLVRMTGDFQTLLEAIVANPGERISALPLLTGGERRQLLEEWNDTKRDYPGGETYPELFEAQVESTPDAIAIVFEERQLTYRELNARANQVAHYLRKRGVGPQVLVGVYLERSIEMVVTLLGILKAGGAYVPLDPTYPTERLAFMVEDARLPIIVTQPELIDKLPAQQAQLVALTTDWGQFGGESEENPTPNTDASNIAYVIYTSGSTGKPKGVEIPRRALSNFLRSMSERPGMTSQDTLLAVTTLSFDIAGLELHLPLTVGARVVLMHRESAADAGKLAEKIKTSGATIMQATPATWRLLVESGWEGNKQLKILCGGEALPRVLADQLLERGASLWNMYGPTETTIWSTVHQVSSTEGPVLVGRPIANTRIYILDRYMQPTPIGVSGELCIGGAGVARGYLNRPELTEEKFIADPFSEEPGARLYRTGDLARYLADGNIELLGRIDHQVKVRGFRIELGEIEAVLREHPALRDAVVLAREDVPGEKRLVGYVVAAESSPTTGELRSFLQNKLPDYMVPGVFVYLEALPLTPNGKVDRNALPAPDTARPELDSAFIAPNSGIEETLAEIWRGVLGVERVGIHDNFFDLGGHSLLAMRVVSHIRDAFEVSLPLIALFEKPTIAGLAERIETITWESQGITQKTTAGNGGGISRAPALMRVMRNGDLPLSFAQQRLWFIDQLDPDSALYNIVAPIQLNGTLNVASLQKALDAIVSRHEVLRTTIASVDGVPRQVIAAARPADFSMIDLSALPATVRKQEAYKVLQEEARRPFNLSSDLMLRATLLKLEPKEHIFLIVMHHIATDGWSLGIFSREFAALYEAFSHGESVSLPELPVQYADFALWQRQWLQGEVLDAQLQYWKEQLAGIPSVLELPTNRPRPTVQTYRGAREPLTLMKSTVQALEDLGRREGATLFMTLLAAFKILLHRYTGQDDIVVGSPTAGRTRMETEGLIGFFVNNLVLRTDLSGDPTFRELLGRVRDTALGAYAHQDLPFEKLVEELQPQRALSHHPLFQVFFTLQNFPLLEVKLAGLTLTPLVLNSGMERFELALAMGESTERLGSVESSSIAYNTDLFDPPTIRRMINHLQNLLAGIVANPEQRISALPLLMVGERRQILEEWNDTNRDYPKEKCLQGLIEAQADRTPDAVAVVYEDKQLTYRELNARANQLAHYLKSVGVGPEVLVGVCLERSIEMVVGIVGVVKAGGAYVPLDPSYPSERLVFMLEDAQVPVLLTQEHLVGRLREGSARVICLDRDAQVLAAESVENPASVVTSENLAYVIYTSGSTGQPKGAMNTYKGICNRLLWMQEAYQLTDADRVLQKTPFSFDVSVWEFFWPLITGARLIVARPGGHQDSAYLVKVISEEKVTTLHFVPSMLQVFLEEPGVENCSSLKRVICSGEALSSALQERFFARISAELHNLYGPTEAAVDVTFWACERESNRSTVPIGRPIANTQIYILDLHFHPVPIGVPGELCIGGVGVARGYLNRPELTAEKFISDPFSNRPAARLYRTGDLARYLADGNIELLGRIDHQVKVRGFRIELGEIEAVLREHPALRDAVVLAREDVPGEKRLVGYVVTADLLPTTGELRSFLQNKLPDYMVPGVFVYLQALPLTPNGKVDRRALPAPDTARPELDPAFVAPNSGIEETLAEIWRGVLGVEQVGIHDNFFDLGGHSLLATQVVSKLRDTFGVDVPLRCLFDAPTVAGLAERIESARRSEEGFDAPPIVRVSRAGDLPLSFAQQRLWFLDQLMPGSIVYNISGAARLTGPLSVVALEQSLTEVLRRHEILRTTFRAVDGQPFQSIASAEPFILPVTDLECLPEAEREAEARRLATEQALQPFDLANGPLFRTTLLRLGEKDHVLQCAMHHAVSDGWSIEILNKEIGSLYQSFSTGQPSPLPELPIQYVDFAHWQRQWLQGEVLETQLSYWKKQLAGAPPSLELPTDRPRPKVQVFQGARQSLVLPESLTEALKNLSRQEGVTLFMTLLAALKVLLCRYTGQEDIVVGTPIAGRNRAEIEGLIGFFVNTLVLRTNLSGNPTFRELLSRVREVTLGAYDHQDVPFEKLVEELQPERDLNRTPLFQVFFNMMNLESHKPELYELTAEHLLLDSASVKFDLSLTMLEGKEGLTASLQYNSDLFDDKTIDRMICHFQTMLQGIVENPGRCLSYLPILANTERHQLLVEWNETKRDYPRDKCIHELFEAQVERTPDAIAVVFENEHLTYCELNQRANQLARYLRKLGVGPEVLVGICTERSLEMVVGVLGILKAGGAYVPLDPSHPRERLTFMMEETQGPVLLTQERLLGKLPDHGAVLLCLDRDWKDVSQESGEDPECEATADNLAYVIFTSGSTGQPKGVMIEQRSLTNYLRWANENLIGNKVWTLPMVTDLTFDACLKQLFGPLLRGEQIWLLPGNVVTQPTTLARELSKKLKVGLNCVPHLWAAVLDAIESGEAEMPAESLTSLFVGGERFTSELLNRSLTVLPHLEIWNLYGPTEATANASLAKVVSNEQVTIGRPIANTEIYILDPYLNPVPVGVHGELYIGKDGLARGYLNQPDLTAERFVPNPFSVDPGARLYKTGDLASYLANGNIELLGRIDQQVKIRGFRIELGEIESLLREHPGVCETVVLAREDVPGIGRLVAYSVLNQEAPSTTELRSFLKQRLPDYMLPSAFIFLDSLPLTPNGKLDRQALPAPSQNRPELEESFAAPGTPVEEVLGGIWAQLLHVDQVGIHDNFFDLGGHSLLATQVVSKIRETFGVEIPLRDLFEASTVAGMAERIEKDRRSGEGLDAFPIVRVSRDGDLPLSFAQQRLWFLDQLMPGSIAYNISGAARLTGPLNVVALEQSLTEIIRRHEILRTTFRAVDGQPFQRIAPAKPFILPVTDLEHLPEVEREAEARRLVTEHAHQPFDLARGPLFRVALLRLGKEDHIVQCAMHHIVSDGWSMAIFNREMSELYRSFSTGQTSALPELPIQYVDFAHWQRQWLQGEVLETQLSYWKKQLAGAPPSLELPTDRPRPKVQVFQGARQSLVLPESLTEALKNLSRQEGVTLFMTLLAALKVLLCRYTGQEDIVVGTPIAGRNRAEIEGLIGFFVNTLVLRTNLSGNPTFRELLSRVREVTLGAYDHQDVPFEKLVEELQPERDLNRTPLFQVFFNMMNLESHKPELYELTAEHLLLSQQDPKFDLAFYARERNQETNLTLVCNADVFDTATITGMLSCFQNLLDQIVAQPEQYIENLLSWSDPEKEKLIDDFNQDLSLTVP